ncbi:hypothetical protein JCM33374_g3355 [Metschnikowia sp. JCM 33374]|nr:hypothetical protein JCM33374_g3355 [Metschnikowia sp. JCM 33374]
MTAKDYILVTGGAGYIGSHTTVELIESGYNVVIVDNLVNSCYDAVARIEFVVKKKVPFHNVDIGDSEALLAVFRQYKIAGVIHFAALKAVGESTQIPLDYYYNNVRGTLSLLKTMAEAAVKTIVFSSSATVYGDATRFKDMIPIPEKCPTGATNPRPVGIPNNLLPYLAQVAVGRRQKLSVFGDDYASHDGTPIRDYIHVVDLAKGHISALKYLHALEKAAGLYREWNLGTGKGSTVFDVYHAFCKAIGRELPYEIAPRRAGDVLNLTANPTRANEELKWQAKLSIEDACKDLWKWTTENPYGFGLENYTWRSFGNSPENQYSSRLHVVSFPESDFEVGITNYGATIQSIKKKKHQYTQGFDTLDGYLQPENPYFGASIGRYANRIRDGKFKLGEDAYEVTTNENKSVCLHGGDNGFDKQFFLGPVVKQAAKGGEVSMEFVYVDPHGHNGFPGNVVTYVKYTIGDGTLGIEFQAELAPTSDVAATAISLTNHAYFTLGEGPSIDGLVVKTFTNKALEVDEHKLATGKVVELDGNLINGHILESSDAFDHCMVVEGHLWSLDTRQRQLKRIFEVASPCYGHRIDFFSTEPAFQLYTGDGVTLADRGARCGLCIEPGRFIDAVQFPEWEKQVILKKGEVYGSRSRYVFN